MGLLLLHKALSWGVGLHVLYLCSHVFICLCSCVCVCEQREIERERESVKESVAMHFYTSSHCYLHMKHHGSDKLNT